jgi:hypothetical protein
LTHGQGPRQSDGDGRPGRWVLAGTGHSPIQNRPVGGLLTMFGRLLP